MLTARRFQILLFATIVALLAIPAVAGAQATRTWVSGVGDDANPCSRTAPCKTFAGAISKTAAKGEINCIDPGGFGAVTITKSITISCEHVNGSILAAGTTGININATATDNVIIRGLDINGAGTGITGIRIMQAKSVKVNETRVFGFTRNAIWFAPSNANARLTIHDSNLLQNGGNGVLNAPTATGHGRVVITDSNIDDNACGVAATNFTENPVIDYSHRCGTLESGGGPGGATISINVFHTEMDDNTIGAYSNGEASVRLGDVAVVGSSTGVTSRLPGVNGGVFSWGNNYFIANATNGTFTGTRTFV